MTKEKAAKIGGLILGDKNAEWGIKERAALSKGGSDWWTIGSG